jgi:hypothetical protein
MSQRTDLDVIDGEAREVGLAPTGGTDLGFTPMDLKEVQKWADNRAGALKVLMEVGLAQTRPEDWSNQGGKAYPEQGACTAIINMVGITITPPARRRENFEDDLGRYYLYLLEADVSVPKFGIGPIPIVGRASSRDQFFAMRSGALRPDSEIDPGDILAKAYTNLRYRAVKAVVPMIANITWDDLSKVTGGRVTEGNVNRVDYRDGSQAGAAIPCPKCGEGTVIEKKATATGEPFWVCTEGKYDSKTKTKSGCDFFTKVKPTAPAAAPAQNGNGGKTEKTSKEMLQSVRQAWKDTRPELKTEEQRGLSWVAFITKKGLDPKKVTLSTAGDDLMQEYVLSLAPKPEGAAETAAEEPDPEPEADVETDADGTGIQSSADWQDPADAQQ